MIGLCTDSNAQLPPGLVERYDVEVVALTVTVDGQHYREGVDLTADQFYDLLASTPDASVGTASPSPGQFALAYERLAARGASSILSIHVGAAISSTINAARLGAELSPVPVQVVDTGAASFVISCAVWEAGEALAAGASPDAAAAIATAVASRCGNVFVVGTTAFGHAGGRYAQAPSDVRVPVLRLVGGRVEQIADAGTSQAATTAMIAEIEKAGTNLRVGVGESDLSSHPIADAMIERLDKAPNVLEVVRYRVGPSVGAHTGPGTAGAVYYSVQ